MFFNRRMSSSPPVGPSLPRTNKFVGESFGLPNVRTIFAGAEEDRLKRENRVILLIGPQSAGKSSLIDFMCNHFYGAALESSQRYHIANEQFDSSTPHKSIITYIFNDTIMDVRPIIIDTPVTGEHLPSEELSNLLTGWLQENNKMRVDVIGVVLPATVRMTTKEEEELQKTMDLIPLHMRSNMVVFAMGSDGAPLNIGILKRFSLQNARVFKINTSCLFQPAQEEALQEHLRGTCWRMSTGNIRDLLYYIKEHKPVTVSGLPYDKHHFPGGIHDSGSESSFSSRQNSLRAKNDRSPVSSTASVNTVVHKEPTIERHVETTTTSRYSERQTTVNTVVNTKNNVVTEERETKSSPQLVLPPTTSSWKRPPSPPLPPPPPSITKNAPTPTAQGLPSSLLEEIRSTKPLRGSSTTVEDVGPEDDVIVVEYKEADPEVVLVRNSPSRPQSRVESRQDRQISPARQPESSSKKDFDYSILNRYDVPPSRDATPITPRPADLPPPMPTSPLRPYEVPPPPPPAEVPIPSTVGRPLSEHRKSITITASGNMETKFTSDVVATSTVTGSAPSAGVQPRQDRSRIYSDETTPPPILQPVTKSVSTTYSTLARMNDDGTMTTDTIRTYTPSTRTEQKATTHRSPISPYGTLSSQLRHQEGNVRSNYDYSTHPNGYSTLPIQRSDYSSKPAHPTGQSPSLTPPSSEEIAELQRTQSGRTNKTESPMGDEVVRYVYDVGTRSHVSHVVGDRRGSRMSRDFDRKRDSRSHDPPRSPRETTIDEPFYLASGYTETRQRSPQRMSSHSLNRLSQPELVHSEDKYAFIDPATKKQHKTPSPQKETLIDFPNVEPQPEPTFQRDDPTRRSRRHSGPSLPTGEDIPAPVPARRTSLGRRSTTEPRSTTLPQVDMRDNPEFSLNPYRKIQHEQEVTDLMRQRENMLRRTREEVQRSSYPGPSRQNNPEYANLPLGEGVVPQQYEQPPQEVSPNRNEIIIPPEMRGNQSPIQVRVGMVKKPPQRDSQYSDRLGPPLRPSHQYGDSDYGDEWDENGTVPSRNQHREQTSIHRVNRPTELPIGTGTTQNGAQNGGAAGARRVNQVNDPRSPPPPAYPTRQYPTTPGGPSRQNGGDDSDVEQGRGQERRPLQSRDDEWRAKTTRGKVVTGGIRTTTTTTTTARTKPYRIRYINWSPSNCNNPRDCCLNILFCVIAPLVILAIIITIIVISLTNK